MFVMFLLNLVMLFLIRVLDGLWEICKLTKDICQSTINRIIYDPENGFKNLLSYLSCPHDVLLGFTKDLNNKLNKKRT